MKKLKAFTLIEMLIVIVIIGILAAALIPKLNSARGRANDVARKADLSQVMAGLISYQIDNGTFPVHSGSLETIIPELLGAGLNEVPSDPAQANLDGVINTQIMGHYGYCSKSRHGQDGDAVVLVAYAETEGGANYVQCDDSEDIEAMLFDQIKALKCTSVNQCTTTNCCEQSSCTYEKGAGELRYIYLQ